MSLNLLNMGIHRHHATSTGDRTGRHRWPRLLGSVAVVAASVGVTTTAVPLVAYAGNAALAAPLRVYTPVGSVLDFTGIDSISDQDRTISLTDTANGCAPADGNNWALSGCARLQMDLSSPDAGKIAVLNPTVHYYMFNNAQQSVVLAGSGAVIDQSTTGDGTPSQLIHIDGTPQQLQDTVDHLQFQPTPGYTDIGQSKTSLHLSLTDGTDSSHDQANIEIRVLHGNGAPTVTAPASPIDTLKSTPTAFPDLVKDPAAPPLVNVTDPEQCNLTKCGAPFTNPGEVSSDDQMLLVAWLADQQNCGTFHLRGGSFSAMGNVNQDTVLKLLTDTTIVGGLNLRTEIAGPILASLSVQAQTVNLQTQPSGSTDDTTVFAGVGDITEVRYALSQITYTGPNATATCDLNVAVSDMGHSGLPPQHGWKPPSVDNSTNPPTPVPAEEIPDAKSDQQVIQFNVTDGHPDVTVNQTGPESPGVDPTNQPVEFTATFSQQVQGLDPASLAITGTASSPTMIDIQPQGPSTSYVISITPGSDGTVIVAIPQDKVASSLGPTDPNDPHYHDYTNHASTSTDNTITYDTTKPAATITKNAGQADPALGAPIVFDATFDKDIDPLTFNGTDVSFGGSTAGGTLAAVVTPVDAKHFTVSVLGMTSSGTVQVQVVGGAVADLAGNSSTASGTAAVQYQQSVPDIIPPTVTVEQTLPGAAGDPTSTPPVQFTATFSEPVIGFAASTVTLGGSANPSQVTISGGPLVYTLNVSGMTQSGHVTASIGAGKVTDAALNPNIASTSADNDVTYNVPVLPALTATINQKAGQADPASVAPIQFTVAFSNPVLDFTTGDVTLSGTAGATTATVAGGPSTYTVDVTGMTQAGTVIASVGQGVAHDAADQPNSAATFTDHTVTWAPAVPGPTVTVNQAAVQADPTSTSPIAFTVVFSAAVTGFTGSDVTLGGTAGATTAQVIGGPSTYTLNVSGMTQTGTVIASIQANKAIDAASHGNQSSTSTDNTVTWNQPVAPGPTVTIDQAAAQADPTSGTPVQFTVVFSAAVTGFDGTAVTLGGTAGATTAQVIGGPSTYTLNVSGMTQTGTVIASIQANKAIDAASHGNQSSTSTDNTVTWNQPPANVAPTVTIDQASGQADPTSDPSLQFTVVFSKPISGFTPGDVLLTGTAGATTTAVTGGPTTFTVTVSGMTQTGTVIASVPANAAVDASNAPNSSSTSTDHTITWNKPIAISTPGGQVSAGVSSGGTLTTFSTGPLQVPAPPGDDFPYGQLSFSANTAPGGLVTFTLTLPQAAVGYDKLVGSTWTPFTWDGETGAQLNGTTITITIRDNGRGDSDPTNGIATDPGAPVFLLPTGPTTTIAANPTPGGTTGSTLPVTDPGLPATGLPATGSDDARTVGYACWFISAGGLLFLISRRRRRLADGVVLPVQHD